MGDVAVRLRRDFSVVLSLIKAHAILHQATRERDADGRIVATLADYYDEWTSEAGREWDRYEVPAEECPRISPEFLAEEREALPAWVYRQEYECSFEETEDQVFSSELVRAAITPEVEPLFGEDVA